MFNNILLTEIKKGMQMMEVMNNKLGRRPNELKWQACLR
jgi:hypothetical protein